MFRTFLNYIVPKVSLEFSVFVFPVGYSVSGGLLQQQ